MRHEERGRFPNSQGLEFESGSEDVRERDGMQRLRKARALYPRRNKYFPAGRRNMIGQYHSIYEGHKPAVLCDSVDNLREA